MLSSRFSQLGESLLGIAILCLIALWVYMKHKKYTLKQMIQEIKGLQDE